MLIYVNMYYCVLIYIILIRNMMEEVYCYRIYFAATLIFISTLYCGTENPSTPTCVTVLLRYCT